MIYGYFIDDKEVSREEFIKKYLESPEDELNKFTRQISRSTPTAEGNASKASKSQFESEDRYRADVV